MATIDAAQLATSLPNGKRLVVPIDTLDGMSSSVSTKFGHAPYFAVVDLSDQETILEAIVPNPCGAEHQHGVVPKMVRQLNPAAVLARGVGGSALRSLQEGGIDCRRAIDGTLEGVVAAWRAGELEALTPEGHKGCTGKHDGSGGCDCHGSGSGECKCGGRSSGHCCN